MYTYIPMKYLYHLSIFMHACLGVIFGVMLEDFVEDLV